MIAIDDIIKAVERLLTKAGTITTIARGGMARVLTLTDLSATPTAYKFELIGTMAQSFEEDYEAAIARFENEIRIYNLLWPEVKVEILMAPLLDKSGRTIPILAIPRASGKSLLSDIAMIHDPARGPAIREKLGENLFSIILSLANAVNFLHEKGVVHNDINLGNFIFTEDYQQAQLIDFATSVCIGELIPRLIVANNYVAPEARRNAKADLPETIIAEPSLDNYALATLVNELIGKDGLNINLSEICQPLIEWIQKTLQSPAEARPALSELIQYCEGQHLAGKLINFARISTEQKDKGDELLNLVIITFTQIFTIHYQSVLNLPPEEAFQILFRLTLFSCTQSFSPSSIQRRSSISPQAALESEVIRASQPSDLEERLKENPRYSEFFCLFTDIFKRIQQKTQLLHTITPSNPTCTDTAAAAPLSPSPLRS